LNWVHETFLSTMRTWNARISAGPSWPGGFSNSRVNRAIIDT
jgi:hypothetical protein